MVLSALALTQVSEVRSAASSRLSLFGDYSLADPAFLGLLPVVLLCVLWGRSARGRPRGSIGSLATQALPRSLRQRMLWLPTLLQALALVCVVLSLARPLRGNVQIATTSEGIDIALVIDRSSSMQYEDLETGRTRLDVVKDVVTEFAARRMTDREGAADNVGIITYARYPQLLCPFTLDVASLREWVEGVEMVRYREEDGTAIGAALAKAVAVLRESDARSRIAVLLTDGENNVHDITPLEAAELAAEEGVRVYTVAAGRYVYAQDWTGRISRSEQRIDTTELRQIAEQTGGRFYRAKDRAELEGIYAEIEALERTPRNEQRFEENYDLYPWFLLLGLGLYGGAWLSTATWARRLP